MTRWLWFAAWIPVGVLAAVTIAAAFALPIEAAAGGAAFCLGYLLQRNPAGSRAYWGAMPGVALLSFYVAYLNRDGPGEVCEYLRGGGSNCTEEGSPWPFVIIGVIGTIFAFVIYARQTSDSPRDM